MRTLIASILLCSLIISSNAFAQIAGIWNDVPESTVSPGSDRLIIPAQYRTLSLDLNALVTILNQAPLERSVNLRSSPVTLDLPLPDGRYQKFLIVESPIMATGLAIRYPEIRTYLGQAVDDPTASVRFDLTPAGFHAMILSAGPTVYIDPYSRGNIRNYISYFKRNVLFDESRRFEEIGVIDPNSEMAIEISRIVASRATTSIGENLRTYRLALASTGEYTGFHGGTVVLGLAAMVTAMNRVNGIYEREVSVRMELIANNDQLVYTNSATDPYTNNSGSTMLGENQSNLDNVIGSANYDIGHVFSTGGGGVAGLGVVCRAGNKARGVTGLPSPIGDPFYVDYVAHEMGHQYGGSHTFNGNAGSCAGGNRSPSNAYEPGSGTTVMAYAGICSPQNTQDRSDDYFHGRSIDEIVAYTTLGSGNSCPVITPTGNNPPAANAGAAYNIPFGTAFFLAGSATDPDNDPLTFTWEQFDLGPAGHPNSPSGNAPIFRSFKGTNNPLRTFPRLPDILANTQTLGEILPSYERTLNFRLTARDNRASGGGVGFASTTVAASGSAGPFSVAVPNTSVSWLVNSVDTVRWDVANTNIPPVNCASVNILLSTDGGITFPTTLAANTPNDGVQTVTVPNTLTFTARIKIQAVGNIFFDISNVNFAIAPVASPVLSSPPNNATNQATSLTLRWRTVSGATSYHMQLSRDPLFTTALVDDSTLTDTARVVGGLTNNVQYYWRSRAKNAVGASGWSDVWNFRTVPLPPNAPTLASPPNNSTNQPTVLTLRWNAVLFATGYRLEVALDSVFATAVIDDSTLTTTQRDVSLANGITYYWRVRAKNAGGWSVPSTFWSFTTGTTSVLERSGTPSEFILSQNYPNPFNPTTVIEFALPREAFVTLEVFNLLGERVALLAEGKRTAGYYSETFQAHGLASALYFYRLHAGDFIQTRKLVLVR